jgi:hypothetical protein
VCGKITNQRSSCPWFSVLHQRLFFFLLILLSVYAS